MGEVTTRELQFMVGHRTSAGLSPMSFGSPGNGADLLDTNKIVETLSAIPRLKVVRVVKRSKLATLSVLPQETHEDIVVVRASDQEQVEHLHSVVGKVPALLLERDYLLQHLGSFRPQFVDARRSPSQVSALCTRVRFHVRDGDNKPLQDVAIVVYGDDGAENQGTTDQQGDASIDVAGGFLNHVAALYVKPAAGCWEKFVERPTLDATEINTVTLFPLQSFSAVDFPGNPFVGWGQRLMGLLTLDPQKCDGAGVRVAIIDSGADTSHPALAHIKIGRDYTNLDDNHDPNPDTWKEDSIHHGTHCAGIIGGNGQNGQIRGFAPKAEVHVLKVFPGGAFNNLVAAINYCIDNRVHVVNCSLGSDMGSQLVTQAVQRARQAGVAVFVAAGNSGGAVQFPANLPDVLCVSALGQAGNFPDYTYHARTMPDGATVVRGQVYPAKFSCHGPEVGVSGPGVGIISTVPNGYAAWDGTSMAAPHLTGLGALLAAHHPALAGAKVRGAVWVDTLKSLICSAAVPTGLAAQFGGIGLPNAAHLFDSGAAGQVASAMQISAPLSPDVVSQLVKAVLAALPREAATPSTAPPIEPGASAATAIKH